MPQQHMSSPEIALQQTMRQVLKKPAETGSIFHAVL